ncbi:metal ABC transporter permease [Shimwellia pseudoproteus]|uniref:metal ABC transporter permease n=1 Tax=Shimwellia pseudoproteus TaxID=570012 RepID=UPI0018ECA5ED|nr:metal ABC transporter permease [Shimwellia pseudoproteus]MBJ3816880.1 metal ABC transporter permease [Shimwellia pseudoproteus]
MSLPHIIDAFVQFGFMRRSLVACLALSLSLTPLGVFLLLRRMSLIGDALSHAVLPGVAIGYLLSGMSLLAMGLGGFIAGLLVALLSGWVSSATRLREDASFAGFYLGSLALGVTLVSLRGSSVDLLNLLFGSLLAVDHGALLFIGTISGVTLLLLALFYRPLVSEAFDAAFLAVQSRRLPGLIHGLFLGLLVMNLVAGFQILGTLMTVGLMMLPAIVARCWTNRLASMLLVASLAGFFSALLGLTWSWYQGVPAGPAIVLVAGLLFMISVLFGKEKGVFRPRYTAAPPSATPLKGPQQ